MFSKTQSR